MQQQVGNVGLMALIHDDTEIGENVTYRIGDLAKEFDITLRTLRFYEDKNLLFPKRIGATRIYSPDDRQRLKLILLSKRFGFSLVNIQEILKSHTSGKLSQESAMMLAKKFKSQVTVLEAQSLELERAKIELNESISYLEAII